MRVTIYCTVVAALALVACDTITDENDYLRGCSSSKECKGIQQGDICSCESTCGAINVIEYSRYLEERCDPPDTMWGCGPYCGWALCRGSICRAATYDEYQEALKNGEFK